MREERGQMLVELEILADDDADGGGHGFVGVAGGQMRLQLLFCLL